MNRPAFVLLSLTAVMAVLVAGLAFIVLRLFAAARQMNRGLEGTGTETAFMTGTLVEVTRRVTAEVEKVKIEDVLREAGGNKPRAAELLQISYKALLAKLKEHGIDG